MAFNKDLIVYKMRAESVFDAIHFVTHNIRELPYFILHRNDDFLLGAELQISTKLCRCKIIKLLNNQSNTHVMIETLQLLEEYTGDRTH